ncbi:MAG TPA: hypothetical protein VN133_05615 [Humibacter sp.]|nr:hypothetical protein [Humibacter sp.]
MFIVGHDHAVAAWVAGVRSHGDVAAVDRPRAGLQLQGGQANRADEIGAASPLRVVGGPATGNHAWLRIKSAVLAGRRDRAGTGIHGTGIHGAGGPRGFPVPVLTSPAGCVRALVTAVQEAVEGNRHVASLSHGVERDATPGAK